MRLSEIRRLNEGFRYSLRATNLDGYCMTEDSKNELERARLNREVVVKLKLGESFYRRQEAILLGWDFNDLPPKELILDGREGYIMQKSTPSLTEYDS